MPYPLLNKINVPAQLRKLDLAQLTALCFELRGFLLDSGQGKAGHVKASLGVTELTVALHYVFNTPQDILIWDVGHQTYLHKILTGRKSKLATLRQKEGLSGFTSRTESAYDPFGAGHSSTSISALAGFIKAAQLSQNPRQHIAVIGDGAITGGMAYEALNYLGQEQANCLVILNDNQSSIDPNVGALQMQNSYANFAQSLGFSYFEEANGNSAPALVCALEQIKNTPGPKLLKVNTQKGLGYKAPVVSASADAAPSFQSTFGQQVDKLLAAHPKLVVLSPAMLSGANLGLAQKNHPERVIDVGIAEQHVVTMAAGLAAGGFYPLIHLYSTFAQRAIDQIIHDLALQKLPALICLDRAGLVGADGATHHGVFDVSLLASLPDLEIMAPSTGNVFKNQLAQAIAEKSFSVIRYPKGPLFDSLAPPNLPSHAPAWWQKGQQKCVVSFGSLAAEAQKAVQNTPFAHLNLPVLMPFPGQEIPSLLSEFEEIITVEENTAPGGLGAKLGDLITQKKLSPVKLTSLSLPANFIPHGTRAQLLQSCGLDATSIKKQLNG